MMDANIQRSLNDKLYDKRKVGALEYVLPSFAVHSRPVPLRPASCNPPIAIWQSYTPTCATALGP